MGDMIVCPSGLAGEVRGLKGSEARMLSDRAALRTGKFLDNILKACWLQTTDPGPYEVGSDGVVDWSKALMGDRIYTLLRVRSRTFGNEFGFKVQCTNDGCRQRFDHAVDLSELPTKELSPEGRKAFKDGANRFEGLLPDGTKFWFRLLTGADEAKMARAGATADIIAPTLARIIEVDGLNEPEKRRYFNDGDISLTYAAIAEMDTKDCGVDTQITVECPQCFECMEMSIPFGQGFLAPLRKKP